MPTRRVTAPSTFAVETEQVRPVAVIAPAEQSQVLGAVIKLDGRGSTGSGELAYAWVVLETPLGSSSAELRPTETDSSAVVLIPDVVGPYTVGLTVSSGTLVSEQATAAVFVQALVVPQRAHLTPDGTFMFKVLGDFWQFVNRREILPILWSGYTQVLACDLLRLFQIDFAKSIRDIQPLFQRRWLAYEPSLDLGEIPHHLIFGYPQSGDDAFTASFSSVLKGTVLSEREFLVLEGGVASSAIGRTFSLLSSAGSPGNVGEYTVNRLNADGSGYIVSAATPFPAPADERLAQASDLVQVTLSDEVRSASTDFSAAGVSVGDSLRIESGVDGGFFRVTGVGVADGLSDDFTLRLERVLNRTRTGVKFVVFKTLRATDEREASAFTDTVFIPKDDADLDVYTTESVTGTGIVLGPYQLRVPSRHLLPSQVGKTIRITSGDDSGRKLTIAGVNEARTGYVVTSSLKSVVGGELQYELPLTASISDRLLVLEGEAYAIIGAELDESQPSVAEGGRGPLWKVTLSSAAAPSGTEGMEWRIAASLTAADSETDFEALGVTAGDLLLVEVRRLDVHRAALVPCQVIGAAGSVIALEVGTETLESGENGQLSAEQQVDLFTELRIPKVEVNDLGDALLTLIAAEVAEILESTAFERQNNNLPVLSGSAIDLTFFSVSLRGNRVVRNTRVPVAEGVASVPALFEYIAEPEVGQNAEGDVVLVAKDGTEVVLDRTPLALLENRDYSLSDEGNLTGGNAETTASSATVSIPGGDLIDRDVRPGDRVTFLSGFDQEEFVVLGVTDPETLRVRTRDGRFPGTTATGLRYRIDRRVRGKFVRFVDGMFTAAQPAPDRLWAETTLFDNSPYVEANFGVLVGVTREQLDAFGTSQVSYRGAVSALMYAWASGPTLGNVAVGVHTLLGLPVTEALGIIRAIDEDYSETQGRILIEDLTSEGGPTGLQRIYLYPREAAERLPKFEGVAVNPDTGTEYQVGDVVPPFRPLTRGAVVSDYVSDPEWWRVGGGTAERDLTKFHTWQVEVDSGAVDSRDVHLVSEFTLAIRPIYTKPEVVLVQFIADDVAVTDSVEMTAELFQFDDVSFSNESTNMVDDTNGSGLALRVFDVGSFSTRVLFEGHDLVATVGSGVVFSARGGFVDVPTGDIGPAFADPMISADQSGFPYEGEEDKLPAGLVRAGDVLYVTSGPNAGRYRVAVVLGDTSLEVEEAADLPPTSKPVVEMEAATDQKFFVQRLDENPIVEGDAIETTAGSVKVSDPGGNFVWDGVAAGDYLVVLDGPDYGAYRIEQVVGDDPTTGPVDALDAGHDLILDAAMTSTGTASYRVVREVFLTNPLHSATDGATFAGGQALGTAAGGLVASLVRTGDRVKVLTGSNAGDVLLVVDVPGDNTIVVDTPFAATESSVEFEVERDLVFDGAVDTDDAYARLSPYEVVELTIVQPRVLFLTVTDLSVSDDDASSATDFSAAGVTTAMVIEVGAGNMTLTGVAGVFTDGETVTGGTSGATALVRLVSASEFHVFEIDGDFLLGETVTGGGSLATGTIDTYTFPPYASSGVYAIAAVSGTALTLGSLVPEPASSLPAAVYSDDADFSVSGATVTSVSGTDYEALGVLPGDVFSFSVGEFVVLDVSTSTITLTQTTGVGPASYTGRVFRRLYP